MVRVSHVPDAHPGHDLLVQIRAGRNVCVRALGIRRTNAIGALFRFLQGLVDPEQRGLDVIDAQRK